jgi:lipid II:glycine glycyltransferase (peptidoglycan interpeptide bridge formation enzyme)
MYRILIVLLLITIFAQSSSATDASMDRYMDTGFSNINENIKLLRSDISNLSEKIEKNNDELRKKNDRQDNRISDNSTQLSSISATLDIIVKILLGTGATGLVGGSAAGLMALQKRKVRNST